MLSNLSKTKRKQGESGQGESGQEKKIRIGLSPIIEEGKKNVMETEKEEKEEEEENGMVTYDKEEEKEEIVIETDEKEEEEDGMETYDEAPGICDEPNYMSQNVQEVVKVDEKTVEKAVEVGVNDIMVELGVIFKDSEEAKFSVQELEKLAVQEKEELAKDAKEKANALEEENDVVPASASIVASDEEKQKTLELQSAASDIIKSETIKCDEAYKKWNDLKKAINYSSVSNPYFNIIQLKRRDRKIETDRVCVDCRPYPYDKDPRKDYVYTVATDVDSIWLPVNWPETKQEYLLSMMMKGNDDLRPSFFWHELFKLSCDYEFDKGSYDIECVFANICFVCHTFLYMNSELNFNSKDIKITGNNVILNELLTEEKNKDSNQGEKCVFLSLGIMKIIKGKESFKKMVEVKKKFEKYLKDIGGKNVKWHEMFNLYFRNKIDIKDIDASEKTDKDKLKDTVNKWWEHIKNTWINDVDQQTAAADAKAATAASTAAASTAAAKAKAAEATKVAAAKAAKAATTATAKAAKAATATAKAKATAKAAAEAAEAIAANAAAEATKAAAATAAEAIAAEAIAATAKVEKTKAEAKAAAATAVAGAAATAAAATAAAGAVAVYAGASYSMFAKRTRWHRLFADMLILEKINDDVDNLKEIMKVLIPLITENQGGNDASDILFLCKEKDSKDEWVNSNVSISIKNLQKGSARLGTKATSRYIMLHMEVGLGIIKFILAQKSASPTLNKLSELLNFLSIGATHNVEQGMNCGELSKRNLIMFSWLMRELFLHLHQEFAFFNSTFQELYRRGRHRAAFDKIFPDDIEENNKIRTYLKGNELQYWTVHKITERLLYDKRTRRDTFIDSLYKEICKIFSSRTILGIDSADPLLKNKLAGSILHNILSNIESMRILAYLSHRVPIEADKDIMEKYVINDPATCHPHTVNYQQLVRIIINHELIGDNRDKNKENSIFFAVSEEEVMVISSSFKSKLAIFIQKVGIIKGSILSMFLEENGKKKLNEHDQSAIKQLVEDVKQEIDKDDEFFSLLTSAKLVMGFVSQWKPKLEVIGFPFCKEELTTVKFLKSPEKELMLYLFDMQKYSSFFYDIQDRSFLFEQRKHNETIDAVLQRHFRISPAPASTSTLPKKLERCLTAYSHSTISVSHPGYIINFLNTYFLDGSMVSDEGKPSEFDTILWQLTQSIVRDAKDRKIIIASLKMLYENLIKNNGYVTKFELKESTTVEAFFPEEMPIPQDIYMMKRGDSDTNMDSVMLDKIHQSPERSQSSQSFPQSPESSPHVGGKKINTGIKKSFGGKMKNIYKIKGSNTNYIIYNKKLISVKQYKNELLLNKSKPAKQSLSPIPEKPAKPAKPAKPEKPAKPAKPAKPVKPTKQSLSPIPEKPAKPVKPTKQSLSPSPPKPAKPVKPTKQSLSPIPPKPEKHVKPTKQSPSPSPPKPAKHVKPTKQSPSPSPPKPEKHVKPTKQSHSLSPEKPAKHVKPTKQSPSPSPPKQKQFHSPSPPKQNQSPSPSPSKQKQSPSPSPPKQKQSPSPSPPKQKQSPSPSPPKPLVDKSNISKYNLRIEQYKNKNLSEYFINKLKTHINNNDDKNNIYKIGIKKIKVILKDIYKINR